MGKKINSIIILLILFMTGSFACLEGTAQNRGDDTLFSGIELNAFVDTQEVPLNENITFTVELSWEGEQKRFLIEMTDALPLENLENSGTVSINQRKLVEGKPKSFKTYRFFLKPLGEGEGKIDSVEFAYMDSEKGDTLSVFTQPIIVKITPPVLEQKRNFLPYLIVILLAIFIIITMLVLKRREKGGKKEPGETEDRILEDKIRDKLLSLRNFIDREEFYLFFQEFHRILTYYIELKYHIYPQGKTRTEIFNLLLNLDLEQAKLCLFKEILTKCDLFEYADEKFSRKDLEVILDEFERILEQKR